MADDDDEDDEAAAGDEGDDEDADDITGLAPPNAQTEEVTFDCFDPKPSDAYSVRILLKDYIDSEGVSAALQFACANASFSRAVAQ